MDKKELVRMIEDVDSEETSVNIDGHTFLVSLNGNNLRFKAEKGDSQDQFDVDLDPNGNVKESDAEDVAQILLYWADEMD